MEKLLPELPKLPDHPGPRYHTWSMMELEVITAFGKKCFEAGESFSVQHASVPLDKETQYDKKEKEDPFSPVRKALRVGATTVTFPSFGAMRDLLAQAK